MNALASIRIRVTSAGAGSVAAIQKQMAGLMAQVKAVEKNAFGQNLLRGLNQIGRKLQTTGRQLQYSFTLPLALAGTAAAKFALENEKAFVRVQKVYGDLGMPIAQADAELEKLRGGFRSLSEIFGIAQADVINMAGSFAAAGSSGIALAKQTRIALETMVLGEMEAADAAKALITIQTAYGLSTDQLKEKIAVLNIVENETTVSFGDLVDAISRSAGAAREAGVDYEHLSALVAALVPTTGSAAQAGNFLKTIFSRLIAPTKEATQMLADIGIEVGGMGWESLNAAERIETLAKATEALTGPQKVQLDTAVAGRLQINRFSKVIQDVSNALNPATAGISNYAKALEASKDPARNMAIYNAELGRVLGSQPKSFDILINKIKNLAAEIIVPLLPAILFLVQQVKNLIEGFTNLSPGTQKIIILGLAFLAVLGPIIAMLGAVIEVVWALISVFAVLSGAFGTVAGFLMGWPLVIAAVIGATILLVNVFEKQLGGIPDYIATQFNKLPDAIRQPIMSIIRFIRTAALTIWNWMSYLNPWAKHSPSLVEQVRSGVAEIAREYRSLGGLSRTFSSAADAYQKFLKATEGGRNRVAAEDMSDKRTIILKYSPEAGDEFDALASKIKELESSLPAVEAAIASQTRTVEAWKAALDQANTSLDAAELRLDQLRDAASNAQDALQAAKDHLQNLMDTPISGMLASNAAIFANERAVNELRLQILQLQQAGQTVEDLQDRMAALAGEIETLRGESTDLRLAGAGSDVLSVIDAQVAALEGQREALEGTTSPISDLEQQLADLQLQGEILDLEHWLDFAPLERELDLIANGMAEMPFDQLKAQIIAQQIEVGRLSNAYEQADAALTAQQSTVDILKAKRDELQAGYDIEKDKLDVLEDSYRNLTNAIDEMKQAINELAAASESLAATGLSDPTGDFEDPGGLGGLGREEGDLQALMDQWLKESQKGFGSMDIFGGIKEKWNGAMRWVRETGDTVWGEVKKLFGADGLDVKLPDINKIIEDWNLQPAIDEFKQLGGNIKGAIDPIINWIQTNAKPIIQWLGDKLQEVIKPVREEFKKWGPEIGPILQAVGMVINEIVTVLKALGAIVVAVFVVLWPIIKNIIEVTFDLIVATISNFLQLIRGIIQVIVGLITGDWSKAWEGIKNIFFALWDQMYAMVSWVFGLIWGIIKGIVESIVNIFQWIYDKLVGHSLIPDLINGMLGWFQFLWDKVTAIFGWIWDRIVGVFNSLKGVVLGVVSTMVDALATSFNWLVNTISKAVGWVWDRVVGVFQSMKDVVGGIFEGLKDVIRGTVNFIIRAFNTIIDVWNRFEFSFPAVDLPGPLDFHGITISTPDLRHIPSMGDGGTVKAVPGGTLVRVAERGVDERITPLDGRHESSTTTNHFHGNLVFPNIKNPNDAKVFIGNLKDLAG